MTIAFYHGHLLEINLTNQIFADGKLFYIFSFHSINQEKDENSGGHKRMIHKTTSADAAMMAAVLPVDPSDLGITRSKPKTSL